MSSRSHSPSARWSPVALLGATLWACAHSWAGFRLSALRGGVRKTCGAAVGGSRSSAVPSAKWQNSCGGGWSSACSGGMRAACSGVGGGSGKATARHMAGSSRSQKAAGWSVAGVGVGNWALSKKSSWPSGTHSTEPTVALLRLHSGRSAMPAGRMNSVGGTRPLTSSRATRPPLL